MQVSLHRRLLIILLGLNLVAWVVSLVFTVFIAKQKLDEQLDSQLSHYMDMAEYTMTSVFNKQEVVNYFVQQAEKISDESGLTLVKGFGSQGNEQAMNLWFHGHQVLVGEHSPRFPNPVRSEVIEQTISRDEGTSIWRIRYRYDERLDIWMAVGVDKDSIPTMGVTSVLWLIFPLLIIFPVTIAVLLWGVRRGLRPLDHLAKKIAVRKPQALDPIDPAGIPREIQAVVTSLNDLLDRLGRALSSERRFTANAAHELQTPLAAIKAEVQYCQRKVMDENARHMLERIAVRVSRATETVNQLLTLARLDPEQNFQTGAVALNELITDLLAEEGLIAVDRGLEIEIKDDPCVVIQGQEDWIKILIRNLLNNAFKYSSENSVISVSLKKMENNVSLAIGNDCEPISDAQFLALTERFYRIPGNDASGVGLGLSIVKRIVELHDAKLDLKKNSGERGFLVEVLFRDSRN